jgi:AcrR family transcriptional regulator
MRTPDVYPPQRYPVTWSSEIHKNIFNATVEIFDECGYSNTCLNHIAKRAGISLGSLFRIFPNKFAIFNAIADYYNSRIECAAIEFLQSDDSLKPWHERVDRIVDRLAEFYRENPKLARAWGVAVGSPEILENEHRFDDWAVESLADYLASALPDQRPAKILQISKIIYWSTLTLLERSVSDDSKLHRSLIDEAKVMIRAYLGTLIVAPPLPGTCEKIVEVG